MICLDVSSSISTTLTCILHVVKCKFQFVTSQQILHVFGWKCNSEEDWARCQCHTVVTSDVLCLYCISFQLPARDKYNCVSLREFSVYTRRAGESVLRHVETSELSTRTLLSDVDPYSNLTIGVSLTNSAGLESAIEQAFFVGSKHPNSETHLIKIRLKCDHNVYAKDLDVSGAPPLELQRTKTCCSFGAATCWFATKPESFTKVLPTMCCSYLPDNNCHFFISFFVQWSICCVAVARKIQGNYNFNFMDPEKAFEKVSREVIRRGMCKLGMEEWLISAVMAMDQWASTVAGTACELSH